MTRLRIAAWSLAAAGLLAVAEAQAAQGAVPVAGGERLVWDQTVQSHTDLQHYRFLLILDDRPISLPDVQCEPTRGPVTYHCSTPLPAMSAGVHVVKVAAILDGVASLSSAPATVEVVVPQVTRTVGAAPAGVAPPGPLCVEVRTCFASSTIAASPLPISVPVETPDGRLWLIEDGRAIRVVADGAVLPEPALRAGPNARLVSILIDPLFASTRRIRLAWIEERGASDRVLVIAAFREVQGTLGQPAVVVPDLALPPYGEPQLAQDGEGRIYVLMPAGSAAAAARDSYAGQVLRFTGDGLVPPGTSQRTPLFAEGFTAPSAAAIDDASRAFWIAGRHADGNGALQKFDVATQSRAGNGGILARFDAHAWRTGDLDVTSVAVVPGTSGTTGSLLVIDAVYGLLKAVVTANGELAASPLDHAMGAPIAVGATPNGDMYLTSMSGPTGSRMYTLYRLTPEAVAKPR